MSELNSSVSVDRDVDSPALAQALFKKTCHDLGWAALTEQLAERCHTSRGAALARALGPLERREEAELRQLTISEARALQDSAEPLSFGGITDVLPALQRSEKGGVLLPTELCEIASTLYAGARLRRHLASRLGRAPKLGAHAERIAELPEVAGPIRDAFDEHGALRDSASPALGGLRQRVNHLLAELTRRTDSLLNEQHIAPHLQDRFVTQREERYVVPVRADARTRIRGIVHGTSASGATVFVEPEEIIELNNKLKLAQLEVAEEERRILADLSQRVEHAAPRIVANLEELAYLDLLDAGALLSTALRANPVALQQATKQAASDGSLARIDLRNARHPLMALAGTEVVPNDIVLPLGGTLIISGPNAGGKTVALKLTGLCALMARAGLHLPVQEGSAMPWFDRILTDVGDDQSLERNLSTFSAHVLNLRHFLARSGQKSLILLDEIAVGTDPEQGAALAQALLEAMAQAQATVLITTHYDRLKALGADGAPFGNASVGYNLQALQPTYRLHLGIPGASSALPVAERLGLPGAIIGRAKELLVAGQSGVDQLMQALAVERERTLQLQAQANELHEAARHKEQQAAELLAQARLELGKARRKAHDEAIATLQAARRELSETKQALRAQTERLRTQGGDGAARDSEAQAEYQRAQRRLDQLSHEIAAAAPPRQGPTGRAPTAEELSVGTKVYVARLGAVGTIASDVMRDKVVVQVGALRLNADLAELIMPEGAGATAAARATSTGAPRPVMAQLPEVTPPRTPDTTIDLRGERLPVAIARTEKFVDDALRESRSAVFVLHGHGTGILRQAIRSHFQDFPGVRSVRPAEANDGGDGVTILQLES